MKNFKKSTVLLLALVLLVASAIGVTFAFIVANSNPVTNTFEPGYVTTAVVEDFKDNEKNDVKIQNTGNVHAYIRAEVIVTWQDEQGNVYGEPVKDSDYSINYIGVDNGNWFKGSDGFYYCKTAIAPCTHGDNCKSEDCKTPVLFTGCAPLVAAPETGYTLHVEVIGSGIQSLGVDDKSVDAVAKAWPAVVVTNGNLALAPAGN